VLEVPAVPFSPVPGDAVLHPGGSPAMLDRNGTRIVLEASTHCTFPILVRAQHDVAPPWHHAWVEVDDLEDPHDVFNGAALVVFPRRYGGLSLALADAMAAGLPVLTTDTPPYNAVLPHEALLVAKSTRRIHLVGRRIPVYDVDSRLLARRIEVTMGNPDLLEELRAASKKWAEAHSWDALRPAWEAVLGPVAA
jgi:glycosyltransferase involved in cell wall biosynthesis